MMTFIAMIIVLWVAFAMLEIFFKGMIFGMKLFIVLLIFLVMASTCH